MAPELDPTRWTGSDLGVVLAKLTNNVTVGALEYFLGWLHFLQADGTLEQVPDTGRLRPRQIFFLTGYVIIFLDHQDMKDETNQQLINNQIDVRLTNAIIIFQKDSYLPELLLCISVEGIFLLME